MNDTTSQTRVVHAAIIDRLYAVTQCRRRSLTTHDKLPKPEATWLDRRSMTTTDSYINWKLHGSIGDHWPPMTLGSYGSIGDQ